MVLLVGDIYFKSSRLFKKYYILLRLKSYIYIYIYINFFFFLSFLFLTGVLGNQYTQPDYSQLIAVIGKLAGVDTRKPPLTVGGELTYKAKQALKYVYMQASQGRGTFDIPTILTKKNFTDYCIKCSGTKKNLDVTKIDHIIAIFGVKAAAATEAAAAEAATNAETLRSSSIDTLRSSSVDSVSSSSLLDSPSLIPKVKIDGVSSQSSESSESSDIGVLDIFGFYRFYTNACEENEAKTWEDLILHDVQPDLSYPGSKKKEKENKEEEKKEKKEKNKPTTTTTNVMEGRTIVLPDFCQESLASTTFLSRCITSSPIWLSSSILRRVIHTNPQLVTSCLIPVLVTFANEKERNPTTSLASNESRSVIFISQVVDILSPTFGSIDGRTMLPTEGDDSDEEENEDEEDAHGE